MLFDMFFWYRKGSSLSFQVYTTPIEYRGLVRGVVHRLVLNLVLEFDKTFGRTVFLFRQSECPSYGIQNRFEYNRGTIYESVWLVLMAKHLSWFHWRLPSR